MGSPQKLELIDRLPPQAETLTPSVMGKGLFEVFEGYDTYSLPSEQIAFLLRHYLIYSVDYRNPAFILSSPNEGEPVKPWNKHYGALFWRPPETTDKYTASVPHIIPASLHNAPDVITVTDHHHFWKTLREEHDIVISRSGQTLTPYWYIKRENPIEPQQMIDLKSVLSNPIWNRPEPEDFGAMIQLWKFLPARGDKRSIGVDTYELQAALELCGISFEDLFHVLSAQPNELQNIEAASQARR